MNNAGRPRLLYLVTEDWYFLSHRLPMARAARDMGCEVVVATRLGAGRAAIEAEGFRVVPLTLDRRGKNPLRELMAIFAIANLYRREKPDLVHHVALKPMLYGSIAASLAGVPKVINAFAGLGYVFIAESGLARLLRLVVVALFRFLMNRPGRYVVVQNGDDRATLKRLGLGAEGRVALIRGSGVDTELLSPMPAPDGPPTATLVGRMLWDKGIGELVEAARRLKQGGVPGRIVLVGTPDPANPASIPEATLRQWVDEGLIEWWGHRADIRAVWAQSHIAVLPSYREGLPMALLEAAACGRPLVAADVPGCRELVRHQENGLLVPARTAQPLADSLKLLFENRGLRLALGARARATVEGEYAAKAVGTAIEGLYRAALAGETLP